MPRLKKSESEKKQSVTFAMNPNMKENKAKMRKCTFTLSEKGIKALEMFSEFTSIPKSVVVRLALSDYLMRKDDFINNPKVKEFLKDTDF